MSTLTYLSDAELDAVTGGGGYKPPRPSRENENVTAQVSWTAYATRS
jgi:hypothetical protein